MKKLPMHQPASQLDFLDDLEEHAVVQWFSAHWLKLVYGFLALFLLLFGLYAWKVRSIGKAETDYYNVDSIFQTFQAGGEGSKEAFDKLVLTLDRQPDLHAKYDGPVAQILIDRAEISQALPFADATLKRVASDHLQYYNEYSAITLLSAQNKLADALQRSKLLKEKMIENSLQAAKTDTLPSFGSTLFAFNLVRISMLEQKAGTPNGEIEAWKEWQRYMNADSSIQANAIDNKAFFSLSNGIVEGKVTLQDYINVRMQQLAKIEPVSR